MDFTFEIQVTTSLHPHQSLLEILHSPRLAVFTRFDGVPFGYQAFCLGIHTTGEFLVEFTL